MIHRIPLLSGNIITLQVYLLGGPITVPQISVPIEGPVTAPLTLLNQKGLLIPWIHHSSGGPIMTPLIWHLVFLIHCLEPKAVKSQKKSLAKILHIRRGQDPLISQS